jgi:hypothetical protein
MRVNGSQFGWSALERSTRQSLTYAQHLARQFTFPVLSRGLSARLRDVWAIADSPADLECQERRRTIRRWIVGNSRGLNCFFPMPYRRHARVTVTNEGKMPIGKLYFNIDYRTQAHPLPADTLYFHAQYWQAQPNRGWTNQGQGNGDPVVHDEHNLTGKIITSGSKRKDTASMWA